MAKDGANSMSDPTEPRDILHQGAMGKAFQNMPWWVQAMFLIGMTFGVPTALLVFNELRDAGYINNPVATRMEEIEGSMKELKGLSLRHEQTSREMVEVMKADAQRRQKRCVLRARTDRDKEACFN